MSAPNGERRPRSREPRATAPLQLNAVWIAGPRTEVWDELWRRLLAAVIKRLGEEDARSEDAGSEYDSSAGHSSDGLPGQGITL